MNSLMYFKLVRSALVQDLLFRIRIHGLTDLKKQEFIKYVYLMTPKLLWLLEVTLQSLCNDTDYADLLP